MVDHELPSNSIRDFYVQKRVTKSKKESKSKTVTIALYRRVSTQEQATDGQSIEAQKEKIEKFSE